MIVLGLFSCLILSALANHDHQEYGFNDDSFGRMVGPGLGTFARNFVKQHAHREEPRVEGGYFQDHAGQSQYAPVATPEGNKVASPHMQHQSHAGQLQYAPVATPEGNKVASPHMQHQSHARTLDSKKQASHNDNEKSESKHDDTKPTVDQDQEMNPPKIFEREKLFKRLRQLAREHAASESAKYSRTPVLHSQRKEADKRFLDQFNKIRQEHVAMYGAAAEKHGESEVGTQKRSEPKHQKQKPVHKLQAAKPHKEAEKVDTRQSNKEPSYNLPHKQLPLANTPVFPRETFCKRPFCPPMFNKRFQPMITQRRFRAHQPFHKQADVQDAHSPQSYQQSNPKPSSVHHHAQASYKDVEEAAHDTSPSYPRDLQEHAKQSAAKDYKDTGKAGHSAKQETKSLQQSYASKQDDHHQQSYASKQDDHHHQQSYASKQDDHHQQSYASKQDDHQSYASKQDDHHQQSYASKQDDHHHQQSYASKQDDHHQPQGYHGVPRGPRQTRYSLNYGIQAHPSRRDRPYAVNPYVFQPNGYAPQFQRFPVPRFPYFARPPVPYPYFRQAGFMRPFFRPAFPINRFFGGFRRTGY